MWSVIIEFSMPPNESGYSIGKLRFLVSDAPLHLLRTGQYFELFEGPKLVATGKILSGIED